MSKSSFLPSSSHLLPVRERSVPQSNCNGTTAFLRADVPDADTNEQCTRVRVFAISETMRTHEMLCAFVWPLCGQPWCKVLRGLPL